MSIPKAETVINPIRRGLVKSLLIGTAASIVAYLGISVGPERVGNALRSTTFGDKERNLLDVPDGHILASLRVSEIQGRGITTLRPKFDFEVGTDSEIIESISGITFTPDKRWTQRKDGTYYPLLVYMIPIPERDDIYLRIQVSGGRQSLGGLFNRILHGRTTNYDIGSIDAHIVQTVTEGQEEIVAISRGQPLSGDPVHQKLAGIGASAPPELVVREFVNKYGNEFRLYDVGLLGSIREGGIFIDDDAIGRTTKPDKPPTLEDADVLELLKWVITDGYPELTIYFAK